MQGKAYVKQEGQKGRLLLRMKEGKTMFGLGKKKEEIQAEPKKEEIPEMNFDIIMNEFEENKASVLKEIDDLMEECRRRIAEEEAKKKDD